MGSALGTQQILSGVEGHDLPVGSMAGSPPELAEEATGLQGPGSRAWDPVWAPPGEGRMHLCSWTSPRYPGWDFG